MIRNWDSYQVSEILQNLILSNSKNQKLQEVCTRYLFQWWNLHHSEKNETPCQISKERENLLIQLPQFMNSHSPYVKEFYFFFYK